jgi:SAM-dependent methyltransferase
MVRLAELFDESYYDSGYAAVEPLRRQLIDQAVKRLGRYLPERGRILDFGAGAGFWSERLRDLGYQVDPFETSAAARRRLEEGGFQAASSLDEVTGLYHAILLMDVLGSCENPAGLLKELETRLRPGGYLMVRTPHFQGTWRRCVEELALRKRETPPWYPTILWRFRPEDLSRVLGRAGMDVVESWFEIQPWTLRLGGWKSHVLWRASTAWDRVTGNGDEFYTVARRRG